MWGAKDGPCEGRIRSAFQVLVASRPTRNKLIDFWSASLTTVRRNGALEGRNCGETFIPLQNEYVGGLDMLQTPYSERGDGKELDMGHRRAEEEHMNVQEPSSRNWSLWTMIFQNHHHYSLARVSLMGKEKKTSSVRNFRTLLFEWSST